MVIGLRAVDLHDSALQVRGTHDVVLGDQLVLVHTAEDIAAGNDITFLEVQGFVLPFALSTMKKNIYEYLFKAGTSAPLGMKGDSQLL